MEATTATCRKRGYVETLTGRRRYVRNIDSGNNTVRKAAERVAINAPIQGTAADMIKIAMDRCHRELEKRQTRTRLLLQVHDELVFDAWDEELEMLKPVIEQAMRTALELPVPIVVDIGVGDNWLEAH